MPGQDLTATRIIAPGGPVSATLRTMLTYAEACDQQRLRDLRRAIADRIEADLALLDALDRDADLEDGSDTELTAAEWIGRGAHRFNVGAAA